jgi:hypothetical protein
VSAHAESAYFQSPGTGGGVLKRIAPDCHSRLRRVDLSAAKRGADQSPPHAPKVASDGTQIPSAYIRKDLTPPAVLKGSNPELGRINILIDYPSMCPGAVKTPQDGTQTGLLLLATATAQLPANEKLWNFDKDRYVPAGQSEFGINEFKLRPDIPLSKIWKDRVFYFNGDKDLPPTIITCPDQSLYCTADVELPPSLAGELKFRTTLMTNWRNVVTATIQLIGGFYAKR